MCYMMLCNNFDSGYTTNDWKNEGFGGQELIVRLEI